MEYIWGLLGAIAYLLFKIHQELREHRRVATMYYTREERAKMTAKLEEDFEYFSAIEKNMDASDRLKKALG